jgi:UDP-3-O-[3-hydroxymyristoyl] glucosamine N-acyltransferase
MVAGGSGVHGDHPPGSQLAGLPAINGKLWFRAASLFGKLPELYKDVRQIKKELAMRAEKNGPDSKKG